MASPRIEQRKAQGKCLRCKGKAPIGQAVCFDCTDKMAAGKQTALAAGRCVQCWEQPHLEGKRYCGECQVRLKARRQSLYQARKHAGLCVQCGKAPQWHGRTSCAYCWGKRYGL